MNTKKPKTLLQYNNLVSTIRIDHEGYAKILDRLVDALANVGQTPTPTCLHIAGETRTGKSCVIQDFLDLHGHSGDHESDQQAIVYATAPSKATANSLLQQLLRGLGDPHWSRGTEANMVARLHTMLAGVSCKMIIIDEFQHLSDKGQRKALVHTTSVLKNLLEKNTWGLVAVGMTNSSAVIDADAQLAGRFDPTMTMPLFDWRMKEMRLQFQAIVLAFVKQLEPFELPDFSDPDNAFRMYMATSGRLGLLAKLVDRAVKHAIRRNSTKVRMSDLGAAFREAIWYAPRFPLAGGPFEANLDPCQTDTTVDHVLALSTQDLYEDNSANVTIVRTRSESGNSVPGSKKRHVQQMGAAL
jgi:hypothetical protein